MKAFDQASLAAFEEEMVAHSKEFSPRLCEVIGDDQLRVALRRAMAHADGYGFTNRGPIRLFIETMFLLGSDFDSDPQYPWAAAILLSSNDQMRRAELLYRSVLDYQQRVSDDDAVNARRVLSELSTFARESITFSPGNFEVKLREEMTRVFPQKVAYIGEKRLTELIYEGRADAQKYLFPTFRGEVAVVALMFAFGHGCIDDPLYPWIAQTLCDERILAERAERLEAQAIVWLDHVIVSTSKEESA